MTLTFVHLALAALLPPLTTVAEQSGYQQTGRYQEVERLCADFPKRFPKAVRCLSFGQTPEGRPMMALVASQNGALEPQQAKRLGMPVVFFQGGIHAGEIDGKDAGFALLRDLLEDKSGLHLLKKVTTVFVPVFNVDGHERFGPHHRPNQNGPQEMGWRVTSQNLNLNRDYVKAEAPEMQALLRFLRAWDPLVYADLHVTDGANFQPDIAVMLEPEKMGAEVMRPLGQALKTSVLDFLTSKGHVPLGFYPSFNQEDDPLSGFSVGVAPPRFSSAYWTARNRFGVLVETHSWKPYAQRVKATYHAVLGLLRHTAEHGRKMQDAAATADAWSSQLQGKTVPLMFAHAETSSPLKFPGFHFTRVPSAVSGAMKIAYDDKKPVEWEMPFFGELVSVLEVTLPTGGYVVPPSHAAWVKAKLQTHGITFQALPNGYQGQAEQFQFTTRKFSPEPYEGQMTVKVDGQWRSQQVSVGPGALLVPVAQPLAMLVAHLFEPKGPDSLVAWGYFNAHMEQKEYMEAYVTEAVAEDMLDKDPSLRKAFEQRLLTDTAFAKDPAARLDFFYSRHPSHDSLHNIYPVVKVPQLP